MKLTDQTIRGLPLGNNGQRYYHDTAIAGLAVCVGMRTRTFTLVIRSGAKRKRVTLGQCDPPRFTLAMAREKARDLLAAERLSKTEIPRSTFEEALETYYRVHISKLRKETQRVITQTLNRRFQPKPLCRTRARPVLESMRRRVLNFGPLLARGLQQRRRAGDGYHLDKIVVRIASRRMYL